MLAHLEPSVELTGGAWFTDQELDVLFVAQLTDLAMKFIHERVSCKKTAELC
jgi:DNA-directed RNA polymerase III subunit RPC6